MDLRALQGLAASPWLAIAIVAACCQLWQPAHLAGQAQPQPGIQWQTNLEAGLSQAFIHNRPVLVYVYSDYCAFSKLMEAKTLPDTRVAHYVSGKFIPTRLNAMSAEPQWFRAQRYEYNQTRRMHDLAYLLLEGRSEFPVWVVMSRLGEVVAEVPGFMEPNQLLHVLRYYAEGIYMMASWEEYEASVVRP